MVSSTVLNYGLTLACLIGLALSIYAYFVEIALEHNDNYEALCDISEVLSCSKAFRSKFGKGFGIVEPLFGKSSALNKPNSLLGIVFYSLSATLAQSNSQILTKISLFTIFLSILSSLYFAYILYFVLHVLCIVCVSTYIVNFANFTLTYYKIKALELESDEKLKQN